MLRSGNSENIILVHPCDSLLPCCRDPLNIEVVSTGILFVFRENVCLTLSSPGMQFIASNNFLCKTIVYFAAESYGLGETEENKATVEILEEIVIDIGSSDVWPNLPHNEEGSGRRKNQATQERTIRGKQVKESEELLAMQEGG
jgi:hypothetical protein